MTRRGFWADLVEISDLIDFVERWRDRIVVRSRDRTAAAAELHDDRPPDTDRVEERLQHVLALFRAKVDAVQ